MRMDVDFVEGGPYWRVPRSEARIGGGPHGNPEECPSYYDGCNCHIAYWDMLYLELDESEQIREGAD